MKKKQRETQKENETCRRSRTSPLHVPSSLPSGSTSTRAGVLTLHYHSASWHYTITVLLYDGRHATSRTDTSIGSNFSRSEGQMREQRSRRATKVSKLMRWLTSRPPVKDHPSRTPPHDNEYNESKERPWHSGSKLPGTV